MLKPLGHSQTGTLVSPGHTLVGLGQRPSNKAGILWFILPIKTQSQVAKLSLLGLWGSLVLPPAICVPSCVPSS